MNDLKRDSRALKLGRRDFMKAGASVSAMALATLRLHGASSQGENGHSGSIDVHAHWVPEVYSRTLSEMGHPTTSIHSPLEVDLEERIKWMDKRGIQMHVLSLDGGMPWQWVAPDQGVHLAQLVNDAAIEAHRAYPKRFIAAIEVPARDPQLALAEINRVAGKPGLRAVHLPNSMADRDYLFAPSYYPLLSRCEELGYPILFHPLDGEANFYGGKARLGGPLELDTNLNNSLGFTFESATTAAKFIITGTLDRFPKLEIVLPHSGGCFPYDSGRIERGLIAKKFKLQRPFREYIRRFHYDTITYYAETLRFLVTLVGADRVVIGTDVFAPMDVEDPNAFVEELNLPAGDRDLILSGNAERLFRL
jgi:aminocarboxymuconate-semialdehyde decarboxylase